MSRTLELAKNLISCPSVTPNDHGCQDIVANILSNIGFKVEILRFGEVQNLWALHGEHRPLYVFVGHTDVVPAGKLSDWQSDPFQPEVRDGYLYGRGAADMKGGIAAMLVACEQFLAEYPKYKGSIGFLITGDEEKFAVDGTAKVVEKLQNDKLHIDWCLVGEPTSKNVVGDCIKIGRRGSLSAEVKVVGKQGHIAHPYRATNPIHKFIPALNELISIEWDKGNEHFPPTSLQVSNIFSGLGVHNIIPPELNCFFNWRYSTELTADEIKDRTTKLLDNYSLNYTLVWRQTGAPFLAKQGDLLKAVQSSIKEITKIETSLSTDGGSSDAKFIVPTGAEVIELGPCNTSIHAVNESVGVDELDTLTTIYKRILEKLFAV